MKKLLLLVLLISSLSVKSQSEDCRTKLTLSGTNLVIKNKSGATKYLIERSGYADTVTSLVAENGTITLGINFLEVSVKPITNWSCSCPYAAVLIKIPTFFTTGVKFSEFVIQQSDHEMTVRFMLSEMTGVKSITIEKTIDGLTFTPAKIILPEEVKINIPYVAKFAL